MPKHYRDRGDAENNFDEPRNQWGWSGYTSRRLASIRRMANLIAQSGGQKTIKVSVLHEKGDFIARVLRRCLGGKWLSGLPDEAELLLSG